jgi:predicted MFS family arabinose efflux permease
VPWDTSSRDAGQDPARSRGIPAAAFKGLVAGQVLAILADRLNLIALIELLSIETGRFARTGTVFELSKLALAMTLPALFLGPLVGAHVDRSRRKRVLVASSLARGLAALVILALRPALPMWTVYCMVALLYVSGLFFVPARCAIVPEMVGRDSLIRANSVLTLGATAATILGFGLGGILVSGIGWRAAMAVDSVLYLLSAAALTLLKPRTRWLQPESNRSLSYAGAVRVALREMRAFAGARIGVLIPPLLAAAGTIAYVLGVALVESRIQHGTATVGLLAGLAGAGMAAGSYITGAAFRRARRGRLIVIGGGVCLLGLAALGISQNLAVMAAALAIAGLAAGPVFVASETAVQEASSPGRQATVFAVRDSLMRTASAAGAVVAPLGAAAVGLRPAAVILPLCLMPLLALLGLSARNRA